LPKIGLSPQGRSCFPKRHATILTGKGNDDSCLLAVARKWLIRSGLRRHLKFNVRDF
jgi:hypothetical protein